MKQPTFADASFEQYRTPTRRKQFLDEMSRVVPGADLAATITPVYPKAAGPWHPAVEVERRLRLHCLQDSNIEILTFSAATGGSVPHPPVLSVTIQTGPIVSARQPVLTVWSSRCS